MSPPLPLEWARLRLGFHPDSAQARVLRTPARRLDLRAKGDGDNEMSLEFPGHARIVGLPGREATIRGFSAVSLLLVDEVARVPDDLYLAIRPMLAVSGGTLWLMSTPHGQRGFF